MPAHENIESIVRHHRVVTSRSDHHSSAFHDDNKLSHYRAMSLEQHPASLGVDSREREHPPNEAPYDVAGDREQDYDEQGF